MAHAKASSSSRLTRIQQVREQEKLWARFQAREFRAAVKDHHVELTNQLHQGWLEARALKQQELERDYSGAVVGVGARSGTPRRWVTPPPRSDARERWRCKSSTRISKPALERHETALGKEFERLDHVQAPYFVAADRRVRATALADKTREDMRAKNAAFADSEEGRRKKLVERLVAETSASRRGRHAADARWPPPHSRTRTSTTWWWTARRASAGVRRARKGPVEGHADTGGLALAPAPPPWSRWTASRCRARLELKRGPGEKKNASVSAFDAAFER